MLVVGIFQSPEIGRAVLKNLHRARFRRAAAVHLDPEAGRASRNMGSSVKAGAAAVSAFVVALGAFIFWQSGVFADYRPGLLAVLFVAVALVGALAAGLSSECFGRM